KIKPDHDHALLQAAVVATSQGALADARQWLSALVKIRQARGDVAGATEILLRIGSLDPADLDARLAAARQVLPAGQSDELTSAIRELVDALFAAGRGDEGIALLEEAMAATPDDFVLKARLARAWVESGDFDRARVHASSAAEYLELADGCMARGDADGHVAMLADARRLAPDDVSIAVRLVRACAERGDYAAACAHLDTIGDVYDGELFAAAGEVRARAGQADAARAMFARLLAREPHRTAALVEQGLRMTEPELALVHVESAADAQLARGDTFGAIAAYRRFADAFPTHLPALLRLVDVSVDAGLHQATTDAQARLAEAHLAAGRAAEARVIAEDLLGRHPTDAQHEDRLRRTLVALGEPHVEAIIAERLNTGNVLGFEEFPLDLDSTPGESDGTTGAAGRDPDVATRGAAATRPDPAPGVDPDTAPAADAGGESFEGFREDITRQSLISMAEQHYKLALAYDEAGMPSQAMNELQVAVRSPRRRFEAAAMLARLSLAGGRVDEAIHWFEHAAEAPAPSLDACRRLLYDLGDTLDTAGEGPRALAVFLELQAESSSYRDVARRVERLRRAGTGSGG
ncbi:MAG TPA: tetratricopeptide repeat protein, partial [Vicinamibacterales bacterium]|nr:tetratricopeptide repeat protein [Vicinamibacterales bacterium]